MMVFDMLQEMNARERECVQNRGEAAPSSAGSQDVRCRQVDDSEKFLIYDD